MLILLCLLFVIYTRLILYCNSAVIGHILLQGSFPRLHQPSWQPCSCCAQAIPESLRLPASQLSTTSFTLPEQPRRTSMPWPFNTLTAPCPMFPASMSLTPCSAS